MEGNMMPSTVDDIFVDYRGRRVGLLKALTTDVRSFYDQCDPAKENLCLYGYPNGSWEVNFPAEEVPPEIPEPALGINFARDGMEHQDWLSLVAVHSDSWLYAVAFYYCARFNKQDRKRLFNMINELPTVFEVVSGIEPLKEKSATANGSNKSNASTKKVIDSIPNLSKAQGKVSKSKEEEESFDEEEEEEEDEESETYCGTCGGLYNQNEFWIGCDMCEKWYHGKCVKMTAARAEHLKQWSCPPCISNKRARS